MTTLRAAALIATMFTAAAASAQSADAPPGWKKVSIFELDRQLAVKRRSHYV